MHSSHPVPVMSAVLILFVGVGSPLVQSVT